MILTKLYLYIFQVNEEGDYPLVFKDPVKTDDMTKMQLSLGNKYCGVIKLKNMTGIDA